MRRLLCQTGAVETLRFNKKPFIQLRSGKESTSFSMETSTDKGLRAKQYDVIVPMSIKREECIGLGRFPFPGTKYNC